MFICNNNLKLSFTLGVSQHGAKNTLDDIFPCFGYTTEAKNSSEDRGINEPKPQLHY